MAIIDKPSDYFNTVLYTGNGAASRAITGVGFQPDWVWVKSRSYTYYHGLWDAVRTSKYALYSNAAIAEDTSTGGTLGSLDSDGFTTPNVGGGGFININAVTYASWNWKAGTSFNNDASATGIGDIDSSGSANTTSGFSIVSWTGTGSSSDQEIVTGLSTELKFVISKPLATGGATDQWLVYVNGVTDAQDNCLLLNATSALVTGASGGTPNKGTTAGNLLIKAGTATNNTLNNSGTDYIAYCFAEKQGYSKFGSYVGNGNADGKFVYTGFKPAMVITKRTDAAADWFIRDNKQDPENVMNEYLSPNTTATSGNLDSFDFISNGFKIRNSNNAWNGSGTTYIYMAFAENPFVTSTGVPATAR